jgi:hypothetical protein
MIESDLTASMPTKHRHWVSSILSPAVRLYLRSQVQQVEELCLQIEGGDRQILTGHIPQVSVSARNAVYQGFHLSYISLIGSNIRVNIGQVLRGKPFRLLAIVPVEGEALLQEADLNASLRSPLLAAAVTDFLVNLLRSQGADSTPGEAEESLKLKDLQLLIHPNQLTLSASLISASGHVTPLVICSGIELASGHELQFTRPQWLTHAHAKRGLPLKDLDGFLIDLGAEVNIQELKLESGQIACRGQVNVIPADE